VTAVSVTPDEIKALEPRFHHLEETPVERGNSSLPIGWHTTAMTDNGVGLGSGLSQDRDTARRIALAETVERAVFRKLRSSHEAKQFQLDQHPTSCGFAAGFEFEKTRIRSICEAVERWARALWIDDGFALMKLPPSRVFLSALGSHLVEPFQDSLYFSGSFSVQDPIRRSIIHLKLGVVVGLTKDGAFPGSRVCSEKEAPWEHACLEAWRHHFIFENNTLPDLPENSFLNRISHFGTRRELAITQIERARQYDWPQPRITFHRSQEEIAGKLFVWRSLCDGYQGWEKGGIDRFVY
jgi:hypothetical protein